MSLTGEKRELELHSSDSEYHESSKRIKDDSPEVSQDDAEIPSESISSEKTPSESTNDESGSDESISKNDTTDKVGIKIESESKLENQAEKSNGIAETSTKNKVKDEMDESSVPPAPKPSGFVFGSAAKTLISFASIGTNESQKTELFAAENQTIEPASEETNASSKEVLSQNETGEEDEVTISSGKAKLFQLDPESKEWKEKGVGQVKLNLNASENYSRIIMRSDGVPRVLVNQRVFPELKFELLQGKTIRLSAIIEGSVQHLLLRFRDAQDAAEFTVHLEDHVELSKEGNQ